jgi:hypothetical protein
VRRFWIGILHVLAGVVFLAPDAAAFSSARLVFRREPGAEHCGNEARLREAVAARLGYDPFFPGAGRTIVASIRREAGGLVGNVELLDAAGLVRGQRELRAPLAQCSELLSGMALAISIAIDPSSLDRVEPPRLETSDAPGPAPPSATATTEVSDRGVSDRGASASGSRWAPELGLGVLASSGLAPSVGAGPAALFGLRRSWFSGNAELRYQLVKQRTVSSGALDSSLIEAAALACGHASAMFLCAELSGGWLRVSGLGVARPKTETTPVWRTGARAGVEVRLTQTLGAQVHTDLLLNLGSQAVDLDGRRAWTSPAVGVLGGAALLGYFP